MIAWLNPLALWGLLATLGAVGVHLLTRQRATRLPFASVRFIRAATTAAIRVRRPADAWLLLIRVSAIGCAALALSQPMLVTSSRRASWDARLSRATVVDSSRSMAAVARIANEAAAIEARNASYQIRIDAEHLGSGLVSAVDALGDAPPSRREIVVISDFQRGSLTPSDLAGVPAAVGVRFVQVGQPSAPASFPGDVSLGVPGVEASIQNVTATAETTTVRFTPVERPVEGLRLSNAGAAADVLLRAVARAGAPAPSREEPMAFVFSAGSSGDLFRPEETSATSRPRMAAWMIRTILRMRRDFSLAEAAREHTRSTRAPALQGMLLARSSVGRPVVSANARGTELVFQIAAVPMDFVSAAAVRAALVARRGSPNWGEYETGVIPSTQLTAWMRQPAPASDTSWRDSRGYSPGDARVVWAIVLALLAIETVARRQRRYAKQVMYVRAA